MPGLLEDQVSLRVEQRSNYQQAECGDWHGFGLEADDFVSLLQDLQDISHPADDIDCDLRGQSEGIQAGFTQHQLYLLRLELLEQLDGRGSGAYQANPFGVEEDFGRQLARFRACERGTLPQGSSGCLLAYAPSKVSEKEDGILIHAMNLCDCVGRPHSGRQIINTTG